MALQSAFFTPAMPPLITCVVPPARLALLGLLSLVPSVHAALFYDEAVSGDLSNLGSTPTPLAFTVGANRVVGTMGGPPGGDPDIITFTLRPGQRLTSIFMAPLDPAERSFYAIAAGSSINMTDGTSHLGNFLTYHYGEILGELALGGEFGGMGFTAPLGSGTYTTWIQELSTRVDYDLTYTVVQDPTPYDTWLASLPTPIPAGQTTHTADPDGDGSPNLLEYALDSDPMDAASVPSPVIIHTPADSMLRLSYPRARAEIAYTVETSTDLAPDSWTSTGVTQDVASAVGAQATATIPFPDGTPIRFLRLVVTE